MSKEDRIDYLESERVKIWEKITELGILIEKKTADYETEAKASSENATGFEKVSKEASEQASKDLIDIKAKLDATNADYASFVEMHTKIKGFFETANANNDLIASLSLTTSAKSIDIQTQIAEIEKIFLNKPVIDEKIVNLESVFTRADDYDSKIGGLFKSITDRKKDIDELYYEIFGSTTKDAAGVECASE